MKKKFSERLKNTKAADTPRKAEKNYRPDSNRARKLGQIAFWVAFGFILLAFLANMLFGKSEQAAQVVEEEDNPAAGMEGVEFAKSFAQTYFTWDATAEGWEKQQAALDPMLGDGLIETAGIQQAEQEWSSRAGDTRLVNVEATGKNTALVTLQAQHTLTKTAQPEEAGEEPKTDTKTVTHFFTVPVAYDAGTFAVYELPSFTAYNDENTVQWLKLKGEKASGKDEENLKNFLGTFFQSYAADAPDKLSYFMDGFETVKGLEGSVEYVEVSDATIVKGKAAGTFDISAYVVMKEPATGTRFTTVYRLTVKEQDGRYVVTKLNQGAE